MNPWTRVLYRICLHTKLLYQETFTFSCRGNPTAEINHEHANYVGVGLNNKTSLQRAMAVKKVRVDPSAERRPKPRSHTAGSYRGEFSSPVAVAKVVICTISLCSRPAFCDGRVHSGAGSETSL